MAERYKVEGWGDREVELIPPHDWATDTPVPNGWRMVVSADEHWRAIVPALALTPVKPPTPEEPEPGAYLIGDVTVFRPAGDRWARWVGPDGMCWDWHLLWEAIGGPDVTITRLVPERVETVTSVEFPWSGESAFGTPIKVSREDDGDVGILIGNREIGQAGAVCTPEGTRELVAALLAASRAES